MPNCIKNLVVAIDTPNTSLIYWHRIDISGAGYYG
jgi:hypothetical protein